MTDGGVTRGLAHNVKIRRVEAEGGSWKSIGDEVNPEKLKKWMRQ